MSYSDDITNKELKKLENKISKLYRDSAKEMRQTWDNYINGYDETIGGKTVHHKSLKERYDEEYAKFISGESQYKNKAEFDLWYETQIKRGEGYRILSDKLATQATEADMIASSYINDMTPNIYSLNRDYEAYLIDGVVDVDFHAQNNQTIRNLVMDKVNAVEFRTTNVNPERDYEWNREQINKALTSAIIQGKSIDKLTDAFMVVMKRDRASAIRNARTAVTSAQSAGRQETFNRASAMGIEVWKEWKATHDERTRDSHQNLDGERVPYNAKFSNGLERPADPNGEPKEVYNCRCGMGAFLPKYGHLTDQHRRETYKEWKARQGTESIISNGIINNIKKKVTKKAKATPQTKHIANYNNELATKCGKSFYDGLGNKVNSCGNTNLVKVWNDNENTIKVASINVGRGKCDYNGIYINTVNDVKGNYFKAPYETTFHESGHFIDVHNRQQGQFYYSKGYKNGLFGQTIKREVNDLVDSRDKILKAEFKAHEKDYQYLVDHNLLSKSTYDWYNRYGYWLGGKEPTYHKGLAYKSIENEIKNTYTPLEYADLSDIFEGATKKKIDIGIGHGKSYWDKSDSMLCTEAFAEMTSASFTNTQSLELIKKYLPESYKVYEDMIKDLANKV